MKVTAEVFEELEGLYVNQIVSNKYVLDLKEKENIRIKNTMSAKRLDELNVSWKLQNVIANAGRKKENWDRYNRTVINEIIENTNL